MESIVLFAHGARDVRWAEPFEALRSRLVVARPEILVRLAFLEMMEPSLPAACGELVHAGAHRIVIVPVFLGQGSHVRRDLPALIQSIRLAHSNVELVCTKTVGEDAGVLDALAAACLGFLT